MAVWEKYVDEKLTTEKLAKIYADHITDEEGNVLGRVWETIEFKDVFDHYGGLEDKGLLRRRCEQIWRNTDPKKQLF